MKIIMLMRHIGNSWKIPNFDTVFYLTHPNYVGENSVSSLRALPVGNVAPMFSVGAQVRCSSQNVPAVSLGGVWVRQGLLCSLVVGQISGKGSGDTWCAGGWS